MVEIIPAILVKSQKEFEERIRLVEPHVSRVQWDIMDGCFVENTTYSDVSVLGSLGSDPEADAVLRSENKGRTLKLKIEADLMVCDPANWIKPFKNTPVGLLIFHIESTSAPEVLIQDAKAAGFKVGLALDPDTPLKQVQEHLGEIDRFQAMGGKSGFGGQEFNPVVLDRIAQVRRLLPGLEISVDIGVNDETAPAMVDAGANVLCAGSFIFNSDNIEGAIRSLKLATG